MKNVTIFNHDVSRWVAGTGPTNHLYSGRVLGITELGDFVQLPPELRSQWKPITAHYERISLAHSLHPVWDLSWSKLAEFQNRKISVFLYDDVISRNSLAAEWFKNRDSLRLDCTRYINSKNNFISLAEQLGLSVPSTICADNKSQLNLEAVSFPCFLKPALAGNGAGIDYCPTADELERALAAFSEKTPLQVQAEVKAIAFINLQYRARDNRLYRLAATEQILEGPVYCGSRYPSRFRPWELVEPMAEWMATRGMKDIFAFDLAVTGHPGEPGFLTLECNPRFNGSTYPTLVAKKMGIENWSYETFLTGHKSLEQINLEGIEYEPGSGNGVILLNWGTILMGKLGVLLAGPEEKQAQLKIQLKRRLETHHVN